MQPEHCCIGQKHGLTQRIWLASGTLLQACFTLRQSKVCDGDGDYVDASVEADAHAHAQAHAAHDENGDDGASTASCHVARTLPH